jgi:hypothetical protein
MTGEVAARRRGLVELMGRAGGARPDEGEQKWEIGGAEWKEIGIICVVGGREGVHVERAGVNCREGEEREWFDKWHRHCKRS